MASKNTTFDKGFNATLFESIDNALVAILGKEAVSTFYFAVEEKFRIPKGEFSQRPLEVLEGLKTILGDAGFGVLQAGIKSKVRDRFGVEESISNITFEQLVNLARGNYIRASL